MNPFILSAIIYLPGTGNTEMHEAEPAFTKSPTANLFLNVLLLLLALFFKENNNSTIQMVTYSNSLLKFILPPTGLRIT